MIVQSSIKVLPNNYKSREDNYRLVDEALLIIRDSALKYQIGTSETTVEGELEEVLNLVSKIQYYYYENKIDTFTINCSFEYNSENFYIENKLNNIKILENKR